MEQAEKKTDENKFKIIANVCRTIPKDEPITYSRIATLFEALAEIDGASQFKSPPVISEKEIERESKMTYPSTFASDGVWYDDKFAVTKQGAFQTGAEWALSLSSERAMEYARWTSERKLTYGAINKMWFERGTKGALHFMSGKSESDQFDIFCKEKGYSNK